ncbi:hypothetical protein C8F01DRAFT_1105670 [Mycena amicta]|nr:hypothetical protein C8F01DRAFT_1105670 [Mycena amicta]
MHDDDQRLETALDDLRSTLNGSVAELSSLGGLDVDTGTLNFGMPTTALPTATSDIHLHNGTEAMAIDMHKILFPNELGRLVDEATANTQRLSAVRGCCTFFKGTWPATRRLQFFSVTDLMKHQTKMETHANACALLSTCLRAFPAIALPAESEGHGSSSWQFKRRNVEESLLRNLRKYVRFSEHFVRKPPRYEEKLYAELNKLHAFVDKFFDLSSKLSASNEKLRLLQLVDSYERMKLDRLRKREERASIRAERAARKVERELVRQQRDGQRPP